MTGVSPLVVLFLERFHVLSDVTTDNVLVENFSIECFGFRIVAGESFLVVRNVDTAIRSTLHCAEDSVSGRSPTKTNVEVALEWARFLVTDCVGQRVVYLNRVAMLTSLCELELASRLGDTLVLIGETKLGKSTASDEKTGGVSRGPISQTFGIISFTSSCRVD